MHTDAMYHRALLSICLLLLLGDMAAARPAAVADADPSIWAGRDASGSARIQLHFFWSRSCPHCTDARPFVEELARSLPWLALRSYELTTDRENVARFIELARLAGSEAHSVPSFIFCGIHLSGFDDAAGLGRQLHGLLQACHEHYLASGEARLVLPGTEPTLTLPGVGEIEPQRWSLPALTLLIAALDAFNPCAFFVLLFLLSLLVHARDRRRMLLIGALFVGVSATVYFAFMAAWLNLFLITGELPWVTLVAGTVAVAIAAVNIKDYFWFRRGLSLSIPDDARPNLFRRMRRLAGQDHLPTLVAGTLLLAIVANAYELLCTAGFPMVFTRILTLHALPQGSYYAYLVLYCIVYALPLLAIVILFTATLGSRKLQAHEGRVLKLVSGMMMLGLGAMLILAPERLSSPLAGIALILGAVLASMVVVRLGRRQKESPH